MKHTGAEIIIKLLEREGIRQIAGIPGGANLPMYDALSRSGAIRHILARHEQGAGFMAQGQARATGRPAVFFATSGPGATNAVTAMADAKLDSIPVICITGQVPQALIGTDAFQEIDTYGLSLPITKHSYLVRSAEELLSVIPEAFRVARSGRPGPVWIDVPKDVQNELIEFEGWPDPSQVEQAPSIGAASLAEAAAMINRARRPIAYFGGGAIHADASALARAFIERGSIPAVTTLMGLGSIPSRHPLSIGMLGMHAARFTNMALHECDLLIAMGARFDDRATGKVAQFCPDAQVIHIDIDEAELNKIKRAHLGLTGDLRQALSGLLPLIERIDRSAWLQRIEELRRNYPLDTPRLEDPMSPYGIVEYVSRHCPEGSIITTDVGQHQMRVAQIFPFSEPRQWLTSGGLGTMGFGLPAAMGAALERPEATVICFSGDGSILMNIQELVTLGEENLNVKVVLCNNNSLGLVHQQQDLFYGKRIFASKFASRVSFAGLAASSGIAGIDLGAELDPEAALLAALRQPGPCLIDVPIELAEHVFPMVPPGAANAEMLHRRETQEVELV